MAELTQTINLANEPFGFSKIAAEKSAQKRGEMARAAQPEILRQESEAERQKSEAEMAAKRKQIDEEVKLKQEHSQKLGELRKKVEDVTSQVPVRNVEDFDPDAGIELASLVALIGAFTGSVSGEAALNSMKGVTDGYRQGKQDLYERSVQKFEADLQAYKTNVANAKNEYEMALKEEAAKQGAGVARLKAFAPELSDSVAAAHLKINDLKGYGKVVQDMIKLKDQLEIKAAEAGIKARNLAPKTVTLEGLDETGKIVPLIVDINAQGFSPQNVRVGAPGVLGKAPPKTGQAGVRERSFAQRTFGALLGVAQDFENLLKLPQMAAMPTLAGIVASDPSTITGSLIAASSRDMTPEDERAFQQITEQIAASLARIEAQGLASGTTKANVASFDALRPRQGDKAINMALYLARIKQEIEVGLKVFDTNYGANSEQKQIAKETGEKISKLLNFTVDDVLKRLPGGDTSLSEATKKLISMPSVGIVDPAPPPEAAKPSASPTFSREDALKWLETNPNHPLAPEIRKRIGGVANGF